MIDHILKSHYLSVIIILNNPGTSYNFLHKYIGKINYEEIFKNIDKNKNTISFLRKHFNIEYFKDDYLFSMCKKCQLKIVKILLYKGANVNAYNDHALRMASRNGYLEIVKILLQIGANIHHQNANVLPSASYSGNIKVVKFLLVKGVNIHGDDEYALSTASNKGYLKVFKILIENKADLNTQNNCYLIQKLKTDIGKLAKFLHLAIFFKMLNFLKCMCKND